MHTLNQLPNTSRVWIYQSPRPFNAQETQRIETFATQFAHDWTSHHQQLKAWAGVLENHFLVLAVDESQAGASGCSIDKSVAFVKRIGAEFGVDFFDRMCFAFRNAQGEVQIAHREEFEKLYKNGLINTQTIVFDNLVDTKEALDTRWQRPLAESWHANFV